MTGLRVLPTTVVQNYQIEPTKKHINIMKKVLTVMAVVAMIACLGSCKKKCNCTTTMNGEVIQTVTMEATNCSKLNVSQTMNGMVQETKCD